MALLSLLGAGGYATFVLVTGLPTVLLLGLFVPLSIGIEWRLQARRSFRVTLALQGRYDFRGDESGGGHRTVGDTGAREADREFALWLTLLGLVAGGAATAAIYGTAVARGV